MAVTTIRLATGRQATLASPSLSCLMCGGSEDRTRTPLMGLPFSRRVPSPAVGWSLRASSEEYAGQDSNLHAPRGPGLQPGGPPVAQPT